jgi:saccharopine dehydrogenase-like NADP-dependent oxidoreductase
VTKILVLGGTGAAGQLIVRHLLAQSDAEITIASRRREKAQSLVDDFDRQYPGRITAVRAEAADEASLRAAFPGHAMVVVASPTTAHVGKVARVALDTGTDYLDIQLGSKKFATLKALSKEIESAGRCFITEAGFHPGLPSALVRYAAGHLDTIERAVTAGYLGINREIPYSEAVDELVGIFKEAQGQIYTDGHWTKPGAWQMRKLDFGGDIGVKRCYSMFFEELRGMLAMFPSLKEVGFFISESHWFTDMVVFPIAIVMLKLAPHATRTVGRLIWWGMMKFRKLPFRTELIVQASGMHAGQPTRFEAAVSHSDAYELTAIPVVAALLQYLDGSARKPGLWMMGHLAEPSRLMTDMKRMGVKLRMAAN